jgi:hypothetical protein
VSAALLPERSVTPEERLIVNVIHWGSSVSSHEMSLPDINE